MAADLEPVRVRPDVVGVVGLAYKPGTEVVERSFGVNLAGNLVAEGRRVVAWDPLAASAAANVLGERVAIVPTLEECIDASDVVVLVNWLPEVESLTPERLARVHVIDCWRCLPSELACSARTYTGLGVGPSDHTGAQLPRTLSERLTVLAN